MQRIANPSTPVRFRPQPPKIIMKNKISTAIIPVAGMGTRMLPATKAIPKEMLPIVNKPIIQMVIEEVLSAGIRNIVFITRSGKEAIENHFDSNFELERALEKKGEITLLESLKKTVPKGIKISSIRQESPKGLGDAILCASSLINEDHFSVLLPDELLLRKRGHQDFHNMVKTHNSSGKSLLLTEKISSSRVSNYGIVSFPSRKIFQDKINKISGVVEKPSRSKSPSNFRIIGRYILPSIIFQAIKDSNTNKKNEIELTSPLNKIIRKNPNNFGLMLSKSDIFDCGSVYGYLGANLAFAMQDKNLKKYLKKIMK